MTLFRRNKLWFIRLYDEILILLLQIIGIIKIFENDKNELLKDILKNMSNYPLENVYNNLKINISMIERRNMKCVVFGETSNGKSAVINALLGKNILPSSIGRTTSCFISIKGCKENEAYLEDSRGNRRNLSEIDVLANELDKDHDDIKTCLRVYWPRQKCRLLENDLEILDSPGVDYTSENDEWIDRYCEDADVFVLVLDCNSTLNQSERDFFTKVKKKIAAPNIIVVENKWDMIENESEDHKQELRDQHVNTVTEFLREDLNLYKECNIEDRMFFVSAKEALNRNEKYSFNNFEECLMTEMTENAIKIKFKPHLDKAREVLFVVNDLIHSTFFDIERNSKFDVSDERIIQFESHIKSIMSQHFANISLESDNLIMKNIRKIRSRLREIVENRTDFSQSEIISLEYDFPEDLSLIFLKYINNLEDKVKDYFYYFFGFKITNDQMKVYFNDKNDFNKTALKYYDNIFRNLTNSSCSIRDLFKEKEASISSRKENLDCFRSIVQSVSFVAMAIARFHPIITFPALAINIAVQALPAPSSEGIPELIFDEFKSFYQSLTNYFIEQHENEVKEILERVTALFINHLREIKATENEFIEKKIKCLELIQQTMDKSEEI